MQENKATHYDIAIVGGGMVGSTLACCLADSGLKTVVLEATRPPAFSPEQPPDLLVSALSMASRHILETVGAWDNIVAKRFCPFRTRIFGVKNIWGQRNIWGQNIWGQSKIYYVIEVNSSCKSTT